MPHRLLFTLPVLLLLSAFARGEDWPTYRHDNRRTGATSEELDAMALACAWSWRAPVRPQPAWGRPAKWDAYISQGELNPLRNYDVAFQPVVAGGRVYFGSSSEDSLYCLDLATGEELWHITVGGPIRVAPAVYEGRVYFGSDDGLAYCVSGEDGSLIWSYRPGPNRTIIQDGRIISRWPVRTGVAVDSGTAYFAAALLPWEESYLCAVDAATGDPTGPEHYLKIESHRTFEGSPAVAPGFLVVPQGRVSPIIYNRSDGGWVGSVWANNGGTFTLITPDDRLISGGQVYRKHDGILDAPLNAPGDSSQIAITMGAWSMVVEGDLSYVLSRGGCYAVNRIEKTQLWNVGGLPLYSLAAAGNDVLLGGDRLVRIVNAENGETVLDLPAEGQVHGLVVADGCLLAATAEGAIHCYRPAAEGEQPAPIATLPENQQLPAGAGDVKITLGPYLQFTADGQATVHWRTAQPTPTILYSEVGRVREETATTEHTAELSGLLPEKLYHYVIGAVYDGAEATSGAYEIDTTFNYNLTALPDAAGADVEASVRELATQILDESGVDRGICVVLGAGDGRLEAELARQSNLRVVVVEDDPERIAALRGYLHELHLGGWRVAVLPASPEEPLPLAQSFADLVIDGDALAGRTSRYSLAEARRIMQPEGGAAWLSDAEALTADSSNTETPMISPQGDEAAALELFYRGEMLPGASDWTHQYGRANNSAFGGETLQGAKETTDLEVQWLGRPGPRHQVDRMVRKPAPLAVDGRLVTQGLDRMIALDAFNGTILWSLEVPQLRRYNLPRDTSNWCSDGPFVYLAFQGNCWRIDAATGEVVQSYEVLSAPGKEWDCDWSYVAREGEVLLGSSTLRGSVYANFWGSGAWYNTTGYAKVCSDNLFALDAESGETRWHYSEGVILNSSITLEEGSVYFVESRHPEAKAANHRIMDMGQLWQDMFLVALDAASGEKLWEQPLAITPGDVMFSLAASDGVLVMVSNGGGKFNIYAFATTDGSEVWRDAIPMPTDSHSQHMSRPAIVGGKMYLRPAVYDLQSGQRLPEQFGCACGTYACSTNTLIFRAGLWNRDEASMTSWDRWRPDCWLSAVPAQGMLLSPEGGGGCSCSMWLETTLGWIPRTEAPLIETMQTEFLDRLTIELGQPLGGGQLHYTLDGTTPTADSPVYSEPFEIETSALLSVGVADADGTIRNVTRREFRRTEPAAWPEHVRISFHARSAPVPEGWITDIGQPEGLRESGYAYGWANGNISHGTERKKNEDHRLDTYHWIGPSNTWRIALEPGRYRVKVSVGDAEHPWVCPPLTLEGEAWGEEQQMNGGQFAELSRELEVTDGVLELGCAGGDGARVNSIEIERLP